MTFQKLKGPGLKQAFCESLDWGTRSIKWFDYTGYMPMHGKRTAKIKLCTRGHAGHYCCFVVTILDKDQGTIDSKVFIFDDYLSRDIRDRVDGRDDYPLGENRCFEVIDHCGWEWYIAKPRTTRPLCQAIEEYVEVFDTL